MKRVLLINMPFAEVAYPSIALGLFKARFRDEGIPCDVHYLNILFAEMVGWENYSLLASLTSPYAGEQLFAHALFGDRVPSDAQYYADVITRISPRLPHRLQQMKRQVPRFLQYCLERIPWSSYDIIGFTSLFEQNLPSLALAYQVKRRFPHKVIVFGGANCEEIMGLTMHRCFPFLDYVCSGEADDTFPELVKRLTFSHPIHDLPGIVYRDQGESVYTGDAPKPLDLDALPIPDYDDYYDRLRTSSLPDSINPYLVMETSRGCWWGERVKCSFCGLNGKSVKFRSKSTPRILDEIQHLLGRYGQHGVHYVRVVDNVINPQYFDDLLPRLAELNLGVQFCFEVRPTLKKQEIKALADAGVTFIQPGLEHLSAHALKLMRKGTTPLHNIQLLKWAKQYGVEADWNIILGLPGEGPGDYARCLELAKVLAHLKPPTGFGPFRLDRFSYTFDHAEELGLIDIRPHFIFRYLYPFGDETLFDLGYHFDYGYRDQIDDGGYYAALQRQVLAWQGSRDQLYAERIDGQAVIVDTRPVAASPRVVLDGARRLIYEYCDSMRTVDQIRQWLESREISLGVEQISRILNEYVGNGLMVSENGRYLSLAVLTYPADHEVEGS
jgi:ribosomal peptide maturation radical SAM protein 1